jgi:hypothetical protein
MEREKTPAAKILNRNPRVAVMVLGVGVELARRTGS